MRAQVRSAVTVLFVPGDRPERFERAASSGADLVVIDLEDSVAPSHKQEARTAAARALGSTARAMVRVNPVGHPEHEHDMALLRGSSAPGLIGLMVPKADASTPWASLRRSVGDDRALVALVETASGYVGLTDIAHSESVDRLAFGAFDFAADVDATASRVTDVVRSELVIVSRAAGKPAPLDSPSAHLDDVIAMGEEARRARRFGFGGKLCVHPRQVEAVADAFRPTDDEVEWARRVIGAPPGAVRVDGEMVDAPVVARAARVLARRGLSA